MKVLLYINTYEREFKNTGYRQYIRTNKKPFNVVTKDWVLQRKNNYSKIYHMPSNL